MWSNSSSSSLSELSSSSGVRGSSSPPAADRAFARDRVIVSPTRGRVGASSVVSASATTVALSTAGSVAVPSGAVAAPNSSYHASLPGLPGRSAPHPATITNTNTDTDTFDYSLLDPRLFDGSTNLQPPLPAPFAPITAATLSIAPAAPAFPAAPAAPAVPAAPAAPAAPVVLAAPVAPVVVAAPAAPATAGPLLPRQISRTAGYHNAVCGVWSAATNAPPTGRERAFRQGLPWRANSRSPRTFLCPLCGGGFTRSNQQMYHFGICARLKGNPNGWSCHHDPSMRGSCRWSGHGN